MAYREDDGLSKAQCIPLLSLLRHLRDTPGALILAKSDGALDKWIDLLEGVTNRPPERR